MAFLRKYRNNEIQVLFLRTIRPRNKYVGQFLRGNNPFRTRYNLKIHHHEYFLFNILGLILTDMSL